MQWLLIALLVIVRQGFGSPAVDINSLSPLSTDENSSRVGRCPTKTLNPSQCPARDRTIDPDECHSDDECSGDSKCCSDGCRRVCIMPLLTSCERQRVETMKRARALHQSENEISLPLCDRVGDYEPVQCDPVTGNCFCVDESGFEMAGTRARSLESINCTNPKPCAGLLCRMLCPYEFELDEEGCPRCECRDPCRGIKCPGSQTCQLENVPCAKEPCRPVPTCKQSRSVESLCPAGTPLTMPGGDRPFLCGNQVGQPKCPELFECIVSPGNDYGVCCTAADQLTKPGSCPAVDGSSNSTVCGVPCENDMQCHGSDKCCSSGSQCTSETGLHCVPPQNFSLCLQQQRIAQLLTIAERKDKGYIPQCDPTNGDRFFQRQCSRNGLVCWCVDPDRGTTVQGTMGPADQVACHGQSNSVARALRCESTICSITCDYGFKSDEQGCPSCDCALPCDQITCPSGKECIMKPDESCPHGAKPSNCLFRPECRNVFVPPCAHGRHLTNQATDEAIQCTVGSKFTCPTGYHCTYSLPNNASFCCPEAGPVSKHDIPEIDGRLPSICEIMRDVAEGRRQAEPGYRLALKSPRCSAKGEFEEVQCEGEECWCVDEFGVELADTRGAKDHCTEPFCHKMRKDVESECPGLLCRLGCDYGFTNDNETGCPMCECRNPCDALKCATSETCQMVVQQCDESPFCPALPYCVSLQRSSVDDDDMIMPTCQVGEPLVNDDNNSPVRCNTRGRSFRCPTGYTCHSEDGNSSGVCCPIQRTIKAGQCPYLVPVSVDSCDSECSSDEDCDGQLKCCSNGCGTQCVEPILKTACQHAQMIAKYTARSSNKPAHRMFIPHCRPDDGSFEPVQCDPVTRACWCVTADGSEVAGTRVPPGLQPQCHGPRRCPILSECVDLECPHGREIDTSGCPTCACRNPCDKVHCRPGVEECRLVQLNCVGEPCPAQPLCLPPLDNPCSYGRPLKDATNRTFECGPMGSSCPSTHKCHLSPLGEFSVCCPKPRDVCFQEKVPGSCKASQLRWSFNERRNRCEAFRFSGCGGNTNNFDSERDCQAVCPSLSSCEELREKNLKLAEKYKKVVFTPKCNRVNGDWEPVQCLEEVGVCWCVDKDGEHIKGTLTRGVPVCGVRQARHHSVDPPICDDPKTVVHACNKSICDGKICLANPRAVCRVDPCGGCRHAFYDPASGRKVDCQSGLTRCQKDVQTVLNSEAWARQGGPWGFQPVTSLFNYQHSLDSYAGRVVLEKDAEILPDDVLTSVTVLGSRLKRQTFEEVSTESASVLDALIDDLGQAGPSELLAALAQESATETVEEATELVPVPSEANRQAKKLDHLPVDAGLLDGEVSSIQTLDDEKPASQRPLPALRDAIKPGFCPPVHSRTYLRVLAQFAGASVCADQCLSDADCDGPARCCPSECGSACTNPIILPTPLLPKPGFCPAIKYQEGCSAGLQATDECSMDADCSGKAKCCFNGCYSSCSQPQEESTGPLVMTLSPPVCTLKGDYAREQSHGELSWCVDANGHPIDDSFTRGSVRCSPNGTVLEQRALGPVCQDPNVQPMVCRDECLSARCPFHPDAICVADPCNKCAVSFVDTTGNPLQCTDRCTMPAETGFCRALFPRYFYNATSETCEEFIFGGCEGNENNFETLEDCRNECEKPDHVCELPVETGLCRASIARWYYNAAAQQCEKFMYGGCGGNSNNFYSYEQCVNRCPDMVVCPKQAATGEMKTCSRHQACRGKTCRGYPDAKCTVDPCNCSPAFVGIDDQPLECLPDEPELMTESRHAKLDVASNEESSTTTTTSTTTTEAMTTTSEAATTATTTTTSTTSISPSPRGKAIEHAHYTRCQKMRQIQLKKEVAGASNNFVYECDHLGRFQPIQCMQSKSADGQTSAPRCWCVDEAGNQVPDTTQFNRGERTCRLVPVMAVAVTLGFPTMDHSPSELEREVRFQMADILNGLSARTVEETLEIVTREDGTMLYFTLVGDNKIDVASHLEDMVKSGHLTLDMHGHSMPADVSTSKFQHKLDSVPKAAHHDMSFTDRILETKEILSQALDIEAPYLAVIVVLSVLASILVCGLIIGLVLHHRRTTGMYPKGAQTLASSPKQRKSAADKMEVIPRGFPRVGINPSDVVHNPQLSPTIPRSKRQNRNADAW